jgi:hypothetical protein
MVRNVIRGGNYEGSRVEEEEAENYVDDTESDVNANF